MKIQSLNYYVDHKGSKKLFNAICDRLIFLGVMKACPYFFECWPILSVTDGEYDTQGNNIYRDDELIPKDYVEVTFEQLYTDTADVYVFQLNETSHNLTREQVIEIRDGLTAILEED